MDKILEEMTLKELHEWQAGEMLLAIGRGDFRSALYGALDLAMRNGYARGEKSGRGEAGWKPIETAPKDGSAVLLYPCGLFGAVSPDIGYWDRDKGYEAWRTLDRERIEPPPTHWMKLPDAPPASNTCKEQ